MRLKLYPLLLIVACGSGEDSSETRRTGVHAVAPDPAESGRGLDAPPPLGERHRYALPTATDDAWPSRPIDTDIHGAIWQSIRHRSIHVHVAVPHGFEIYRGALDNGRPVVRLVAPDLSIEIVDSNGPPHSALAGEVPPGVTDVHRAATDQNLTLAYTENGERVVIGWSRSASCRALYVTSQNEEMAFDLCAGMGVPHPGPVRQFASPAAFSPPMSDQAAFEVEAGVRRWMTGYFTLEVTDGRCASADSLRASHGGDVDFTPRVLPHGPALEGQLYQGAGSDRWGSGVGVWMTRAGYCCSARLLGELPISPEQVTYVAELCDALGQPAAPRSPGQGRQLDAQRGATRVLLREGEGTLTDANAPPAPGARAPIHAAFHGECAGGGAAACCGANSVMLPATSLDEVRVGLERIGFTVTLTE